MNESRDETGIGADNPSRGLSELGQIALTVDDIERATAFYRDLGVRFLFDAPPDWPSSI